MRNHAMCEHMYLNLYSLENMFKELLQDIEGFQHPGHGTLTGWAKQGMRKDILGFIIEKQTILLNNKNEKNMVFYLVSLFLAMLNVFPCNCIFLFLAFSGIFLWKHTFSSCLGVLLLNACLTVRAHQANSHQGKQHFRFCNS